MSVQLDLFPETIMTPEKRLQTALETYMVMFKVDPREATLVRMRQTIDALFELYAKQRAA